MPVPKDTIDKLIKDQLPNAVITITSLKDDNDHYQATVTSSSFIGLTPMEQHRLVYRALGDILKDSLHAFSLTTHIPT